MPPMIRPGSGLAALALAVGLLSSTAMAAPTTATVDEFLVAQNGTNIFNDSFASTTALNGGTGTLIQATAPFTGPNPGPADYFVRGTIQQNNPSATLNTATGITVSQPPPFLSSIQLTSAFLQTGNTVTSPHDPHELTPATGITVEGLFNLSEPTTPLGTYDIIVTNRIQANGFSGNQLELRLRNCVAGEGLCGTLSGPVLQYYWADFTNNKQTLIGQFGLSATELNDPQMLLELTKAAGSDAFEAVAEFGTGTIASFATNATVNVGLTTAATDVFTPTNQFVLAGFEAFQPTQTAVPEPSSLLLLSGGLLGLIMVLRTRRA